MKKPSTLTSFFSLSKTQTDDSITPLTEFDIPFYDMNMHCYTNPVYYGDGSTMSAYINDGDVVFFKNGNLRDIFIKNKTAGSNGQVVIVATVPTEFIKEKLRL